jgi:hypothetical protein
MLRHYFHLLLDDASCTLSFWHAPCPHQMHRPTKALRLVAHNHLVHSEGLSATSDNKIRVLAGSVSAISWVSKSCAKSHCCTRRVDSAQTWTGLAGNRWLRHLWASFGRDTSALGLAISTHLGGRDTYACMIWFARERLCEPVRSMLGTKKTMNQPAYSL